MRHSTCSILLALAAVACAAPSRAPSAGAPVSFSLPSNDGALVSVPLRGASLTVLDFFAPTCEPCAKKVPELLRRRGEIESRGGKLVLVAVLASGESSADAERALATWGAPSAFLVDRGDVSRREADVRALPAALVLGPDGAVRWRAPANASADDIVAAVR